MRVRVEKWVRLAKMASCVHPPIGGLQRQRRGERPRVWNGRGEGGVGHGIDLAAPRENPRTTYGLYMRYGMKMCGLDRNAAGATRTPEAIAPSLPLPWASLCRCRSGSPADTRTPLFASRGPLSNLNRPGVAWLNAAGRMVRWSSRLLAGVWTRWSGAAPGRSRALMITGGGARDARSTPGYFPFVPPGRFQRGYHHSRYHSSETTGLIQFAKSV
jgi:hypothetical protein